MRKNIVIILFSVIIFIFIFSGCSLSKRTVTDNTYASISKETQNDNMNKKDFDSKESEYNSNNDIELSETVKGNILNITPEEVKELISKKNIDYFLIDVRTPEEFAEGYIETANLIPVNELESRLNEIPKDKIIIVYCRSGNRSRTAAEILINNGFELVYDMGGIISWQNKDFEIIIPD